MRYFLNMLFPAHRLPKLSDHYWVIAILVTSGIILLLTLFCLWEGITTIFMHLYYIPIILLAYHYQKKGVAYSVLLSLAYLAMVVYFEYSKSIEIFGAVLRVCSFILVAVVVSFLSINLKTKNKEYRALSEFNQGIVSNANVWLSVLDEKGKILVWNKAAEDISGFASGEVIGRNNIWKQLYPDREYRSEITQTIKTIIDEKRVFENFVTVITAKNGERKTIAWNTRAIPGEVGTPDHFVAIGIDISLRKKAEDDRGAAYEKLAAQEEKLRQQLDELTTSQKAIRDSEEEYRNILRTAMDGFALISHTGAIIDCNDAFCRMIGYSREEMRSLSLSHFEAKEFEADISRHMSEIIGKGFDRFESQYRRKDGGIIDVEVSVVHAKTHGGHFISFHHDITLRKKAEETLRQSEEQFRSLFDSALDMIQIIKPDGSFLRVNPAWKKTLGFSEEEINKMSIFDIIDPNSIPHCSTIFHELISGTGAKKIEAQFLTKDGKTIFTEGNCSPRLKNGTLVTIRGIFRDVTERKRTEETINLANRKLALMNEVTYQFIQNKVTALRGYTELIRDVKTDAERIAFFEKEEQILADIHQLIKNTKEYQELELTQLQWIPVEPSIRMAVALVSLKKGIAIEIDLHGLELRADPLIEKIFYKLIDNAEKHGKTLTRITFSCHETPDGLIFICDDDGVGVPHERKIRLFERGAGERSGFDLFFIRECLALYGMSIAETGEPGKGARFEISVPKGAYQFTGTGQK